VGTVVVGSGIGLYYYLRVVLVMLKPAGAEPQPATPAPLSAKLALASLAVLLLWSGIFPQPFMETLHTIAETLS
jgi:NADH-quinone oxidoreductase subunit N